MASTSTRVVKPKKFTPMDTEILQKTMEIAKNITAYPETELKNSFGVLEDEDTMETTPIQQENPEESRATQKPPPIIITSAFKDLKAFHLKMKSLIKH
ncbi:hypothetical protein WA026_016506 [Henosepilachna vigintioctopunctata]|uniref:Uncharacterized protein n=1 Tax=Henosepilachna vigintioctopunctata TaxID=420089 RepID=A0AAW1VGA8_9CUCU